MPLLKDGKIVADSWTRIDTSEELPQTNDIIVDLERFQAERDALLARNGRIGVLLKSNQSPEAIAEDLDKIQLVALEFPVFKDGRAYSYARLLRERFGFDGELRAVGQVLRDQMHFMNRAGFDAFEVDARVTEDSFAQELGKFSAAYQPSSDGVMSVLQKRHAGQGAKAAE